MKFIFIIQLVFLSPLLFWGQQKNNLVQQKPTTAQLNWLRLEYYWFIHFGPNTFTDLEWGHGTEKEEIFNPKYLDCEQWCRTAKASGATQIIITAKHHDGFCLWPSKYSKHTVKQSNWKNGNGDVLKELSAACKKYQLKFGIYISPWDRNHPDYGTEKYNEVFVQMMQEIFTNYGPINELWWDGANGEGPNGKKQVYDWPRFIKTVRRLSPSTVIFSDVGPDIRWCGNEEGIAGMPNYNYLNIDGMEPGSKAPSTSILNAGELNGKYYIPAECDLSIRPGWFYHKAEDDKVKTPETLFQLYLKSVGRGANLLLNIPPTPDGLIHKNDSLTLIQFKKLREENLGYGRSQSASTYLLSMNKKKVQIHINKQPVSLNNKDTITIELPKADLVNCIVLQEKLTNGQRCTNFKLLYANENNEIIELLKGTTIGSKRIVSFDAIKTKKIYLLNETKFNAITIGSLQAYLISEALIEKK